MYTYQSVELEKTYEYIKQILPISKGFHPCPIVDNSSLEELIMEVVHLQDSQIEDYVTSHGDEEIDRIAGYIPHDFYDVDMHNLISVLELCISREICIHLYKEWQKSFDKSKSNRAIRDLLRDNYLFSQVMEEFHISSDDFAECLQINDAVTSYYSFIKNDNGAKKLEGLENKLGYFGVDVNSKLYRACEFAFYMKCEKSDYLCLGKDEICEIARKYYDLNLTCFRTFIYNYFSLMDAREDWELHVLALAPFLVKNIGKADEQKTREFFSECESKELIIRYHNFLNLYNILNIFGFDVRSEFWKQYEYVSVKRYRLGTNHNTFVAVMEMNNCYATEFINASNDKSKDNNMGKAYFFKKEVFYPRILNMISVSDPYYFSPHNDIKGYLFNHQELLIDALTHLPSPGWQKKFQPLVIKYGGTRRI